MSEPFFTPGPGPIQISAEAIAAKITELGRRIADDHGSEPLHLICVLNGAFVFVADLVRAIERPVTIDFLSVSSYGSRTETSGEVRLVKDLDQSLKGKHVLLVEDIVDTGLTMQYLLRYLEGRGPLSLKVAALLSKPSRRLVEVPVHYLGFEIPDAYVYGYGLDIGHRFRNLPFVTSLRQGDPEP